MQDPGEESTAPPIPASADDARPGNDGRPRLARLPRLLAGLGSLAFICVIGAIAILTVLPPAPAGTDAPADQFSADRALEHVDVMAQVPHPLGTQANDEVREYILEQLRDLGLDPQVQSTLGLNDRTPKSTNGGYVDNIYVVIPGTDSTGKLFLAGHYDTTQFAPGAGDDTSATASMLETARALKNGPPLRNDVVMVFTDAEESGGVGSAAFVDDAPIAQDGGVILNWETRGSRGPTIMFETTDGNARLAAAYAKAAPHPVATSAAVEVYRRLQNQTDFTQFLNSGRFTGMNSAFLDGGAVYHTPQDNIKYLSAKSLQSMGDNMLALTKYFGNADMGYYSQPASGDSTYFNVFGSLLRYPGWLVWPFSVISIIALGLYGFLARRNGLASYPRLAIGWVAGIIPLIVGPLAVEAMWKIMVLVHPGYSQQLDLWRPELYRVAVPVLIGAVFLGWMAILRRRLGVHSLIFGGLAWLVLFGILLTAIFPGVAYLLVVPAMATGITGVVALLVRRPWVDILCALISAFVALVVFAPALYNFMYVLGFSVVVLYAFISVQMFFGLAPAFDYLFRDTSEPKARLVNSAAPAGVLAVAIALLISGLVTDTFSKKTPEPSQLMYAMDADTGQAQWVSENPPTSFTQKFVGEDTESIFENFPYLRRPVYTGPAQPVDLPAPTLEILDDTVIDGHREVTALARPGRTVRLMTMALFTDGGTVTGVTVDDKELGPKGLGGDLSIITIHAPALDGVKFHYTIDGSGPVTLRTVSGSDGLSEVPGFEDPAADVSLGAGNSVSLITGNENNADFSIRPDNVDIAGTHTSELLMISTTKSLP